MTKLVKFDWAIKYLLRNKANFDILEGFLSELLKMDIHIEQILESEGNQNHATDKYNRVDLLAKTAEGQYIIIEVQCSRQWDYLSRVLYGASKVVCEYIGEGDAYRKIRKVISVSIVFFDVGQGKDYLYKGRTTFKGMHCGDTLELNPDEREVYAKSSGLRLETPEEVFPEFYIIKVTQFQEKVQDKLDEWIYFLKNDQIEKNFSAQGLQSAAQKLDILKLNEKDRRAYEHFREGLHDDASFEEMVEIEKDRARAETRKQTQLQIARSMKQSGMPDSQIAAFTQLSLEEIKTA